MIIYFPIARTVIREKTRIEYTFCKGMTTLFLVKERSSSFVIFQLTKFSSMFTTIVQDLLRTKPGGLLDIYKNNNNRFL